MVEKGRKILIIMKRIAVGGTYSSFLNLLSAIRAYPEIDITVGLIDMRDKDKLPKDIKIEDLSIFGRTSTNRWSQLKHELLVGLLTRIRLKILRVYISKNSKDSIKSVSLVQKLEYKEAKAIKGEVDFSKEYDLVISWCEMYTNYLLAYKIKAPKKIAWIHPHYEQAGFDSDIDREMIKNVDALVAVSKQGVGALRRVFPEYSNKFYCVYNKSIVSNINEKAKQEYIEYPDSPCNMITVARIQNISKALDRLIKVLAKLKGEGYRFKWRIVGDGEDFEKIRQLVLEHELCGFVEMLGAKSNPFPYIAASDLFLLCSRYEGFPMVVDEAMILGVPVLVTDYAAASEQVEQGSTGFIVENSFDGIYKGLKEILDNPQRLVSVRERLKEKGKDSYTDCGDFVSLIDGILG